MRRRRVVAAASAACGPHPRPLSQPPSLPPGRGEWRAAGLRRHALVLFLVLLAGCRREPEKTEAFRPPADGRLTEAQVRTYTKDGEKGFSRQEYAWVRDRVHEARLAGMASGLDRKVIESRRRILRSLEERRRTVKDPTKRAELDRDIAEVRRLLQGAPPEPSPSVQYNAGLVARLENKETK